MDKELKLQSFIREHSSDWEKILSEKPYCIKITRDNVLGMDLVMFKYSQIDSDFHNEIVRECRGLVLEDHTFRKICIPFFKFGNFGESYCPDINWKHCYTEQKVDGSLIKVVKINGKLLMSTNGTINAFTAPLQDQIGCKYKTFGELFEKAIEITMNRPHPGMVSFDWIRSPLEWLSDHIQEDKTYMFELVSPYNRVVVPWDSIDCYFLGERDNETLQETCYIDSPLKDWFHTPKMFPLTNIDECIEATKKMDWNEEGFVVCDNDFNRVKIKSPSYVAVHHLRGENGMISYRRALEIVKQNEVDEILTYFPEFRSAFDSISEKFDQMRMNLEDCWEQLNKHKELETRKDKAIWITGHCKYPGFIFAMLDKKGDSIYNLLMDCPNDRLLRILGLKDIEKETDDV